MTLGNSTGRYQQVYSSTAFPGPITFSGIQFDVFNTHGDGLNEMDAATFQISFSTTSAGVGTVSSNQAGNVGADHQLFGTYSLGGTLASTLVFNGLSSFTYDPSKGNLLIDVLLSNVTTNPKGDHTYVDADTGGSIFSRGYTGFGGGTTGDGIGLVTTFLTSASTPPPPSTTSTTPEPGTFVLAALGFSLAVGRVRRSRTKVNATVVTI